MEARLAWHRAGHGARHVASRLPVDVVYTEELATTAEAIERERQLKRWSGDKKAALARGDKSTLKKLSRRRRPNA